MVNEFSRKMLAQILQVRWAPGHSGIAISLPVEPKLLHEVYAPHLLTQHNYEERSMRYHPPTLRLFHVSLTGCNFYGETNS